MSKSYRIFSFDEPLSEKLVQALEDNLDELSNLGVSVLYQDIPVGKRYVCGLALLDSNVSVNTSTFEGE